MSFGSANKAAKIQADSYIQAQKLANEASMSMFNTAMDVQKENYATTESQLQPYLSTGTSALEKLNAGTAEGGQFSKNFSLSDLTVDPGYQFDLQQGTQAANRAAAASGTLNSGGTLKAIANYTTGLASNEINNAYNRYTTNQTNQFNRLTSLANIGQNATNTSANAGANMASGVTNAAMTTGNTIANTNLTTTASAGNATASGITSSANFLNNTLGSVLNNASQYAATNDTSIWGGLASLAGLALL